MIALPDINVLLALAWSNHPHHDAAHDWFAREAAAGWATCLFTQSGFLRLSMNLQIVGVAIDCSTACNLLDGLVAHPGHQFHAIAPALSEAPFGQLATRIHGYRQVSDSVLLLLARIGGMRLVTFDKPIASLCPWPETILVLPLAPTKSSP